MKQWTKWKNRILISTPLTQKKNCWQGQKFTCHTYNGFGQNTVPSQLSLTAQIFLKQWDQKVKNHQKLHSSLFLSLSLSLSLFFLSLHSDEKMKSCEPVTPTTTFLAFLRYSSSSSNCNSQELLRDFATRELNAFLWISLIAITALLLRKVAKLFKLWAQARKIPGPLCSSFYGHSNLISRENLTGQFSIFFSPGN